MATLSTVPVVHAASTPSAAAAAHPSRAFWLDIKGTPAASSARGMPVEVKATKLRSLTLDRASMAGLLAGAPMEFTAAARSTPLVISLPDPAGNFQRFAIVESPVMEAGLAAKHPDIKTYSGRGIDDPTATLRMDLTPLGFHASVRGAATGGWYVDPYYKLDQSLYASYYIRDLPTPARAPDSVLTEAILSLERSQYHAGDTVKIAGAGFAAGAIVSVSVRNANESAARQVFQTTASAEGKITLGVKADTAKTRGSYVITATDGRSTTTTGYQVLADGAALDATSGPTLKRYRVAMVSDPTYATYFGGSANVTPAKTTLMNRITQIYEYEASIRLVLIDATDALNLDTTAQITGANGPCGGTACFTAAQVASCGSGTLTRNQVVVGLLAGAGNYDIGHIVLGNTGGGIAQLGVVGVANKARGCTGVPTPVGDYFAVDYTAHEMGHQFAGNHTFNGTVGSCAGGNRNAGTSVEPGSGSSIMAYAGICGTNDLQPHSDPYFSYLSFEEITAHTSAAESNLSEVQMGVLTGYTAAGGALFQLRYNGNDSATIGTGGGQAYTTAGVKAAIEAISGWPAGGTVTISALTDTGFTVTYGGTLASVDVPNLQLVNCTSGCSGYVNDIQKGGITTRQGIIQTATGNTAPTVTVAGASYTIPMRTPFALTGTAVDAEGDAITYMWEQTDRGGTSGTSLIANAKTNGPLFRQFGVRAVVSTAQSQQYNSPGENLVDGNPTRVFPDMVQILANNTNAESGACSLAGTTPTVAETDCFSEYLPTVAYVGTSGVNGSPLSLNFRLTARDGKGGVGNGTTQLQLASGAGPFLVTSFNAAATVNGGSGQTVTWDVANTSAAPVSAANVKITLSTDGGLTFPYVLAASTPNNGSRIVALPNVGTTTARIKVEAVGNVFFDVNNANFTIRMQGDANGDGAVNCADLAIVRAAFGTSTGQPGFDARADLNGDGVVNLLDLTLVSKFMTAGTTCAAAKS